MSASGIDPDVLLDFIDAIFEQYEAREFDRLMSGKGDLTHAEMMDDLRDGTARLEIRNALGDEASALDRLRLDGAVERLTNRFPDLWAQANMEVVDA